MLPYIAAHEAEVKRKHPEIREEWIAAVLEHPHHPETQDDGRIQYYGYIVEARKWLLGIMGGGALADAFRGQPIDVAVLWAADCRLDADDIGARPGGHHHLRPALRVYLS